MAVRLTRSQEPKVKHDVEKRHGCISCYAYTCSAGRQHDKSCEGTRTEKCSTEQTSSNKNAPRYKVGVIDMFTITDQVKRTTAVTPLTSGGQEAFLKSVGACAGKDTTNVCGVLHSLHLASVQ